MSHSPNSMTEIVDSVEGEETPMRMHKITWRCEHFDDWKGDPAENPHTEVEVETDDPTTHALVGSIATRTGCSCGGAVRQVVDA